MQRFAIDDPALALRLGDAQARFDRLVAAAEPRARAFYRERLGRDLSIADFIDHVFAAVQAEGDEALHRFAHDLDGSDLAATGLVVARDRLEAAREGLDSDLCTALETAAARIRAYQERLLPTAFGERLDEPLGVRWVPVARAGGYVPGGAGGSVPLCSSVLMNLVPARVAGVGEVALATPARADGSIHPAVLAAARIAGVHRVYPLGGVPAIAALAIGTATVAAVDCLVGPGNLFVTLAKRAAYGRVALDMLAGPSEVLVVADGTVPAAWAAADLLAQAEHDPLAMPVLLSLDPATAAAVEAEVERQLANLPDQRRAAAAASVADMGLSVVCADPEAAIALIDRVAPEHLELLVSEPRWWLERVAHAGAIFCGGWSTEPLGDYVAGPSHTLPTGGGARLFSGVGVDTFLRRQSIINLGRDDLAALAGPAVTLARAEGLEAHARAVEVRLKV